MTTENEVATFTKRWKITIIYVVVVVSIALLILIVAAITDNPCNCH